jgi:hypothetical protein
MNRHWHLDGPAPRAERELLAAQEAVLRDREAQIQAASQAG